jgi:hypothetical protein
MLNLNDIEERNGILFYPASLKDIIDPVVAFPNLKEYWFADYKYSNLNQINFEVKIGKLIAEESFVLNPSQDLGRTNPVYFKSYTYEQKDENNNLYYFRFLSGDAISIFRYFFLLKGIKLSVFFYRRDSVGLGGSAMYWFKKKNFRCILHALTNYNTMGILCTDGSCCGDFDQLKNFDQPKIFQYNNKVVTPIRVQHNLITWKVNLNQNASNS